MSLPAKVLRPSIALPELTTRVGVALYVSGPQLERGYQMNMPLALHRLLMAKHAEIAADIKSQAFEGLDPNRLRKRNQYYDPTDARQIRHMALLNLHWELRAFRRRWNQPTNPLDRKLRYGQVDVNLSMFRVFDRLLAALPYLRTDGAAGEVLSVAGAIDSSLHYPYIAHCLNTDNSVGAPEVVRASAVHRGVEFTLHRFFPELNGSDVVGCYTLEMECSCMGMTIADELQIVAIIRDKALPVFAELEAHPEKWTRFESRLMKRYEARLRHFASQPVFAKSADTAVAELV